MNLTRQPLSTDAKRLVMTDRSAGKRRPRRSLLMKRNKKRALIALLAIGVLAAGGAAFTTAIASSPANNTNTAAFGGTAIKGATAAGVTYQLSSDGQFVTSADVYFTTSQA